MTTLRLISLSALTLALAACGAPQAETAADAEAGASEARQSETAPANAEEGSNLDVIEISARDVCSAGDDGFGDVLADNTGFASRGADARVHAAWKLDGETYESIIHTPSLALEDRVVFDGAVADFLRHNLVTGFDRAGITGAFRFRDGRFCVVQTEREVIEALRDAVVAAEAAIGG